MEHTILDNVATIVTALGAVAVPVLILFFGAGITRGQTRDLELQRVRYEFFKQIMPDLNRLMCYMTFIGRWRSLDPPSVVRLKRDLDERFFCAAPLFSEAVKDAYNAFMALCFVTFGSWGEDAKIVSTSRRREEAWVRFEASPWHEEWNSLFTYPDPALVSGQAISALRQAYDQLITVLVADLKLTQARLEHTTSRVSLNAFTPPGSATVPLGEPKNS